MAILLAFLSAIGYAVQNAALAPLYRIHSAIEIVAIRGLTLGITMSPLLLLAGPTEIIQTLSLSGEILVLASALAVIGNYFNGRLYAQFPVGVASALAQATLIITNTILGIIVFSEYLSPWQIVSIVFVLVCSVALGLLRSNNKGLVVSNWKAGLTTAVLFGIFLGGAYTILVSSSRAANPLVAAYFWEFGIGAISALFILVKKLSFGKPHTFPAFSMWRSICLRASPTLLGTGCFAFAAMSLPIAIVSTICSVQLLIGALIAKHLLNEHLGLCHWALMLSIIAGIAAMKLF